MAEAVIVAVMAVFGEVVGYAGAAVASAAAIAVVIARVAVVDRVVVIGVFDVVGFVDVAAEVRGSKVELKAMVAVVVVAVVVVAVVVIEVRVDFDVPVVVMVVGDDGVEEGKVAVVAAAVIEEGASEPAGFCKEHAPDMPLASKLGVLPASLVFK